MFFGTPHGGPKDILQVALGKLCVRWVQAMPGAQKNRIMEALKPGSLFDDLLKDNFSHQLNLYHIVSFYEGIGDLSTEEPLLLIMLIVRCIDCAARICSVWIVGDI